MSPRAVCPSAIERWISGRRVRARTKSKPEQLGSSIAVDSAIAVGEIPISLPFIRREAVAAIKGTYPNQEAGTNAIAAKLREFYRTQHAEVYRTRRSEVERGVTAVLGVYSRNVFPTMNVTFGTYPNNVGHNDFPGCFRCHDDNHKSKDGKVIRQDCDLCHEVL